MEKEIEKIKEFQKWFDKYIIKNFGKKCTDFTWGCHTCHAHFVKEIFDDFIEELVADENWEKKQETKSKINKNKK